MRMKNTLAASAFAVLLATSAAASARAKPDSAPHFVSRRPLVDAQGQTGQPWVGAQGQTGQPWVGAQANARRAFESVSKTLGNAALMSEEQALGRFVSKDWAGLRGEYRLLMLEAEARMDAIIPARRPRKNQEDLDALAAWAAFFFYHDKRFAYDDSVVLVSDALEKKRLGPETATLFVLDLLLLAGVEPKRLAYVSVAEDERNPYPYAFARVGDKFFDFRLEKPGSDSIVVRSFGRKGARRLHLDESGPDGPLAGGIEGIFRTAQLMARSRLERQEVRQGRQMLDAAIALCTQALEKMPKTSPLHYWAGALMEMRGGLLTHTEAREEMEKALAHLQQVLKKNPHHFPSLELESRILARLGRWAEAKKAMKAYLDCAPDGAEGRQEIERLYNRLEKP